MSLDTKAESLSRFSRASCMHELSANSQEHEAKTYDVRTTYVHKNTLQIDSKNITTLFCRSVRSMNEIVDLKDAVGS
jgi:hypothetical protein